MAIKNLMIFAAGVGSRMGSLTQNTPKSLLKINSKPFLYYALELALTYPFTKIIINTHYLADQINTDVNKFIKNNPHCPEIIMIHEEVKLETGGAIKNAFDLFDEGPIFTLNSDIIIKPNLTINPFEQMQKAWNPERMDMLLLLQKFNQVVGYKGKGDFELDNNGRLSCPKNLDHYEYMYSGLQILSPKTICLNLKQIFSLSDYYHDEVTKLYGVYLPHQWYHANESQDINTIEQAMNS